LTVDIVAPEAVPMATVLGPQVGEYLRRLHERNVVVFHLQTEHRDVHEQIKKLKDRCEDTGHPLLVTLLPGLSSGSILP
jgi:hypothetical protein